MVDEEVVMETIRKMKESGLEDSIIISTLQDIGLNETQAQDFIDRASGPAQPKAEQAAAPAARKPAAAQPAQRPQARPQPRLQPKPVPQPEETFEEPAEAPAEEPEEIVPEEDLGDFSADEEAALSAAFEEEEEKPARPQARDVPARAVGGALSEEDRTVEAIRKIREIPQRPAPYGTQRTAMQEGVPQYRQPVNRALPSEENFADQFEETAMKQAATEIALEEQEQTMNEMQQSIKKIESRPIELPPGATQDTKALMLELENLRQQLEETRAMASATRSLMEKVLEVNRKILSRLP
ncbi:MAG: hypothetical protein NT067_07395 [Candidatus Diapherotrites archaeon]|nr:hypothetical protein [Candidatus Diapherotrites archaeon]